MNAREERVQKLLTTFKQRNINSKGSELIEKLQNAKNIDNRLKAYLEDIIPACLRTGLIPKEAIERFLEEFEMKVRNEENDEYLKITHYRGYLLIDFKKDEKGNIIRKNEIVINEKEGLRSRIIAHEASHGNVAQFYEFDEDGPFYIHNVGFIRELFDKDLLSVKIEGVSLDDGFIDMLTSKVLSELKDYRIKIKKKQQLSNVDCNKYMIKKMALGKKINTSEEYKTLNPYGFQYDEFDSNKHSLENYIIYKKIAELLDYASDGKAAQYHANDDFNGFMHEFDSFTHNGNFIKLLALVDSFYPNYFKVVREYYFKGKVLHSRREHVERRIRAYKDERVEKIFSKGIDLVTEYFVNKITKQVNENIIKAELMKKITQFEKMLPKEIDNSYWYKKKEELLKKFAKETRNGLDNYKREKDSECNLTFRDR